MKIKKININEIKPFINNPRIANEDFKNNLNNSLDEFGMVEPIIINTKTLTIIGGHQRFDKIYLEDENQELFILELGDISWVFPENDLKIKSENHEKALNIALNNIGATWDKDKLTNILEDLELKDFDISLTSLDDTKLKELDIQLSSVFDGNPDYNIEEDNYDVDKKVDSLVECGDIWKLGNHLLMCGNSTKKEDVNKLVSDNTIDLVITDPPYNVDYVGKTKTSLKIQNDNMDENNFYNFLYDAFKNMKDTLKPGAVFYIFHADANSHHFRNAIINNDIKIRQCLIWNKNSMVLGRQDYHWKHEPILYGWKDGASHLWVNDRKQITVLDFNRPSRSKEHPTMKPIDILAYLIGNNTKEDYKVLDLFGGSGSTLIACEQTKRKAYIMELDPYYCDVIINRWEEYTNEKATKV